MSDETVVEQPVTDSASFDDKLAAKLGIGEEPIQEPQADAVEQTEEQTPEDTVTPDDSEEIEFEDLTIALPKEKAQKLKSAIEGYKDYTQKTQSLAEQRRMVEVQQQASQAEKLYQEATAQEMDKLAQIKSAIKQFDQVNWAQLDTDTLVRTKHSMEQYEKEQRKVEESLNHKRQALNQHMQGLRGQAITEAANYLSKNIPGWKSGNEVDQSILSYGINEGLTETDLVNLAIAKPQVIKALHKAMEWEKLQSQKQSTAKRTANVPPVIRPGSVPHTPSKEQQKQAIVKQLHQAKDPVRKKALFEQAIMAKFNLKD
jgi:hypothetical protein